MKRTFKRITALFLVLLLTASLLASCSGGGESENTVTEVDGIPVYENYKSEKIDLGLAENETVFDIIEMDGMLRATIGVVDPECDVSEYNGTPYLTEYRWYSMDYVEDTAKRERTKAHQEFIRVSDPNVDFVLGGEPEENEYGDGLRYDFYRDGEPLGEEIIPPAGIHEPDERAYYSSSYSPLAHVLLYEDVAYAWINSGIQMEESEGVTYRSDWYNDLYVNGTFIDTYAWKPGMPKDFGFFGIVGIEGVPYALLSADGKGRLAPLTPETTELPTEGKSIDVVPTGGACSDERFGYFMSNTELWRTDGEECVLLVDMVVYGAINTSGLRAVRSLSDGRILVAIDGKLIELAGSEEADKKDVQVCNIGVYDFCRDINGEIEWLELLLAKYNEISGNTVFQVKRYDSVANLNLAVLTGDIAMVITQDRFALNNYVKQNRLADLEAVAPKLFEKGVLIENIVDVARVDGICYYLPRLFQIGGQLITDPSRIAGGKLFETRKEYCDFIIKYDSEYLKAASKEDMFTVFAGDLDEWINWEEGTCHFDDGTFADILEFCNQGITQEEEAEYYDWWLANTESQYWSAYVTRSFTQGQTVEDYRFTDLQKALEYQKSLPLEGKSELVQVDFSMPSTVHDGFEIIAGNFFAVIDLEESREAAGDLLTWFILEDVEDYSEQDWPGMWTFSINREETDQGLRQHIGAYIDVQAKLDAMDDEMRKSTYAVNNTYLTFQMYNARCGEEQYNVTWDYINKADHFRYSNNELFSVMKEEAANYFGGLCTAKQAAEYVQNRIYLYLAEQS